MFGKRTREYADCGFMDFEALAEFSEELSFDELLSVNGGCGGGCGGGGGSGNGYTPSYTPNPNPPSKPTKSSPSITSTSSGCGGTPVTKDAPTPPVQTTTLSSIDKIEDAISKVGDKEYVVGKYQCDEYVNEVIEKAGYKSKDFYVDNPSGKNVDQHISELTNSGKSYSTNASSLDNGTYVVFMSDNDKSKASHASILVVENGSAYCTNSMQCIYWL